MILRVPVLVLQTKSVQQLTQFRNHQLVYMCTHIIYPLYSMFYVLYISNSVVYIFSISVREYTFFGLMITKKKKLLQIAL